MIRDIQYALRQLFKNPGHAAVAIITLALGIGATTAIFSVVYGVLISPYPYLKPEKIWTLGLTAASGGQRMRPYQADEFQQLTNLPVFAEVMGTSPGEMLLTGANSPETLRAIRVSASAAQFLGVPAMIGRTIGPSDIRPDGEIEPVVTLSFRLWQRLFGGEPDVLGKTLRLNDQLYTIVGVMPPRFSWWTSDGLWLPLSSTAREPRNVFPIVRLRAGASISAAEEQWHGLQTQFARDNPARFPQEKFASTLTNYLNITVASGEMEKSLHLLFGAVALLLLIACANVANLQLSQASTRAREMAVRLALGAQRRRLVRQLLTESLLVSLAGGALGLIFAALITHLMTTLMPGFNVPSEARIEVNNRVLFFCFGVSVATGVIFGLVPALQASRPNLAGALNDQARGSSAAAGGKLRAILVITEVALSVVLLVSAGLTIRGFVRLQQVDFGFNPNHVVTIAVPLAPKRYNSWELRNRFALELEERVRHLPGVVCVSIGNGGLPFGGDRVSYRIQGQSAASDNGRLFLQLAGSEYLQTLRIPLHRGRMFSAREVADATRVAVINETAAKLWAGEDPLGQVLRLDDIARTNSSSFKTSAHPSPNFQVIGVIADTQNDGPRSEPQPAALIPFTIQAPLNRSVAIRTEGSGAGLLSALQAQVREMDPDQPLRAPRSLWQAVEDQSAQPRFCMALFSLFAAFGLSLASAGIYSVLSFFVTRRTREIGVRMALGAHPQDVLWMFLKSGGLLIGIGLIIGLAIALALARVFITQIDLFQVGAVDPVVVSAVIVVLLLTGFLACWRPARRATRVDPMVALRAD